MRPLRRLAPNLSVFYAFEAAARLGGFARAAAELGVTQSAVSQSVRALEDALGVALFDRVGRRVRLTEAGCRLQSEASLALSRLEAAALSLGPSTSVVFSGSTAFVAWWLAPRLGRLNAAHPDLDLRLATTDRDVDLGEAGAALGVRFGDGAFAGYESRLLAEEVVFPICAPGLFSGPGQGARDKEAWTRLPLIHLEEPHRPAFDWRDWERAQNTPHRAGGLRINDYALVLQAALEGQGVAIGWAHLVDPLIAQGRLAPASAHQVRTGLGFHLVHRPEPLSPAVAALRDWMISAAAQPSATSASNAATDSSATLAPQITRPMRSPADG